MSGSVGQYTIGWFPFAAYKSVVGAGWTRENQTTVLGMGDIYNLGAQNDSISWDLWFDSVVWKYAQIHTKGPNAGICSIQLDGAEAGTIDMYSAGAVANTYAEVASVSVTSPGVKTFTNKMTSKNASSGGYQFNAYQSAVWIRTGGTPSTPSGTDTPGYTHELIAWMGTKSNTNWATRTQASTELSGGRLDTDTTAQNNLFTYDIWREARTYKVAVVHRNGTDQGIFNITGFSGTQTVDAYAAAAASNAYSEVTAISGGSAAVATVQVQMATKNASSTAYGGQVNSIKWISTGA